jgi:hypothetical protein
MLWGTQGKPWEEDEKGLQGKRSTSDVKDSGLKCPATVTLWCPRTECFQLRLLPVLSLPGPVLMQIPPAFPTPLSQALTEDIHLNPWKSSASKELE